MFLFDDRIMTLMCRRVFLLNEVWAAGVAVEMELVSTLKLEEGISLVRFHALKKGFLEGLGAFVNRIRPIHVYNM